MSIKLTGNRYNPKESKDSSKSLFDTTSQHFSKIENDVPQIFNSKYIKNLWVDKYPPNDVMDVIWVKTCSNTSNSSILNVRTHPTKNSSQSTNLQKLIFPKKSKFIVHHDEFLG